MKLQQMLSLVRQAIDSYDMISEGDKIAVGMSGGKDSLALLYVLSHMQKFYPKHYELIAITVDLDFDNIDFQGIADFCQSLGVPYHIAKTEISKIVFDIRQESNPCALCAKMRKGALNDLAKELACNKIAYGHHKDDLIESMMMSFIFEGRMHTFSPVTYLDRTELTVIRPFLYLYEGQVKGFVKRYELPVVKSPCPVDGSTKREYVKQLVNQINYEHKGAKSHIYRAIMDGIVNVECPPVTEKGKEE